VNGKEGRILLTSRVLQQPAKAFQQWKISDSEAQKWVRDFQRKLDKLVKAAVRVRKPIAF
jgi:hypothetical protein